MALALCVAFLVLAVALRMAVQYRIAGDLGIRLSKRPSSILQLWLQVLLVLALVGVLALSVLQFTDFIRPHVDFGTMGRSVGLGIGLIGMAVTAVAQFQMGASWRIGVDESETTDLVTHGLYARIRNPIYTGIMLFSIGLLVLLPTVYMVPLLVAGYLSIDLHVRKIEEPHLLRQHGDAYAKYVEATGRYLPRLTRHHR